MHSPLFYYSKQNLIKLSVHVGKTLSTYYLLREKFSKLQWYICFNGDCAALLLNE